MSRTDPEARRAYMRAWRAKRKAQLEGRTIEVPLICLECGVERRTTETLRVHRILAHGVE